MYAVADLHIGDDLSRVDEFVDFTKFVLAKENRYIITLGDMINNNLKNSVGSTYEDIIPPSQQKKELVRHLEPVRERILAMTGGNHEYRSQRDADHDPTEEIAFRLGAPYCEDEIIMRLAFGRTNITTKRKEVYTLFASHGCAGGRTAGNAINRLIAMSSNVFAHCYIGAHKHQKSSHRQIFRLPDMQNKNVLEVEQLFVLTPSWLNYGGYARRKQFQPQVRGATKITLHSRMKKAVCEI